ncbi:MAG: hypothetical protein QXX56_00600 [Candidatus Bathyarchaeia archaeon]
MVEERSIKFWQDYGSPTPTSGLEVRVAIFLVLLMLCVFITIIGTTTRIEIDEARRLIQEQNNLREAVKSTGLQVIFGNNFMHALIMFVPIVGPCWGFYVLYNTGRFIAALSIIERVNPVLTTLTLFFFPFTWMEYISYALAISESLFLAYSIIRREFKREFIVASKFIVFCAILLLAAAFIEFHMIFLLELP